MKFQQGDNRFRVLSKPLLGWEDWEDSKPIRYPMDRKPSHPIDPKKPVKHFWSFIVWNCNEEQIQILNITQTSVRDAIEALVKNEDWGDPYGYDIKVTKSGEKMETEYVTLPCPHKEISPTIIARYKQKPIYLPALMTGDDPYDVNGKVSTEGQFTFAAAIKPGTLDVPSLKLMETLISQDLYPDEVKALVLKTIGVATLAEIPQERAVNLFSWLRNRQAKQEEAATPAFVTDGGIANG